jgi:hypothetical protein
MGLAIQYAQRPTSDSIQEKQPLDCKSQFLLWFEAMWGLTINLHTHAPFRIGCDEAKQTTIANLLNCKKLYMPFTYPRIPICR